MGLSLVFASDQHTKPTRPIMKFALALLLVLAATTYGQNATCTEADHASSFSVCTAAQDAYDLAVAVSGCDSGCEAAAQTVLDNAVAAITDCTCEISSSSAIAASIFMAVIARFMY